VRADLAQHGVRNLEAVELGLREAMAKDARRVLEQLYQDPALTIPHQAGRPGEKRQVQRAKEIQTLFGPITLRRDYLYCPATGQGRAPLDDALGLIHSYSPTLVRLATRAAARTGYEQASQDLAAQAAIHLEGRQIQRLAQHVAPQVEQQLAQLQDPRELRPERIPVLYVEVDGTGVPMVGAELAGRAGKQPDGTAKTREVKLGCVFTQTTCDPEGLPLRDYASTTYVGSFEPAPDFGARIRAEALRRGAGRADRTVVIGDGAAWVWELARVNFPDAVQILDLYHALEHLHTLCDGLYGQGKPRTARHRVHWTALLKQNGVGQVIAAARARLKALGARANPILDTQIAYFEHHQARMLYLTFRNQGLFYGSGVIEAGCKTVVGQRLKQSGMFWSLPGAQNILTLRCALLSRRWDACWDRLHHSNYLHPKIAA
jgi:hypothetical protein